MLPPVRPLPLWATEIDKEWIAVGAFNRGRLDYFRFFLLNTRSGERIDFLYSHEDTLNKWYKPGWVRAVGDFDWVKQELLPLEYDWGKKNQTGFDGNHHQV